MKFDHHWKSHQGWRGFSRAGDLEERFSRHHRGGGPHGPGGRGEGRRRFFERGEFKFALLELLATAPMHGYQLIKAMEERTGGLYTPSAGSIYPNLQLLEDMSYIGSSEADGKKLYHITEQGIQYLRQSGKTDQKQPEKLWDRRGGRYKLFEKQGKHELRELMKEWSGVISLMASAARGAQEDKTGAKAERFQDLMVSFQTQLNEFLASDADKFAKEADPDPSSSTEDDQQEKE
ncbi:PadR family transcriptional regulator [Paenibacillus cremeus]|uniref:Helix-turn-helix transcriptional regulator n=1 Tax=Paenibacillus cremeus TaxID=2163881 RepID=A0A559KB89_9BACL|nr:PadR family transcriptional regulator [Paenibacillus cremeus]TVY09397.1 helix-turn-helix transcriptional regulator [Paenibacillus cremeus]